MTRLRPVLAATAALALVVTACDHAADPGPNYSSVSAIPSASSSARASTSEPNSTANVPSGESSPTQPAQASQNSSDGAFAFVAYYWKQVDWAYSTVDGDVLTGLYLPSCKSCASSQGQINAVRGRGHSLQGGHLTIDSQKLAPASDDPSASFAIDTSLRVEPLTEVDANGAHVAAYPASAYVVRAFVAWTNNHFQVTGTANVGGRAS